MAFSKHCYCTADAEFIDSAATVAADNDGYFLFVKAGGGMAGERAVHFTLPVARMVVAALQEAIQFAEQQRERK